MGGRLGTGVTLEIVGSRRSRGGGLGTVRVEAGAVAEHGAGDVEQAVGHRAQGSGVAVAAGAQCLILGAAGRIALGGDASPVVGGVAQPVVGGQTAHHDHTAVPLSPRELHRQLG